MTPEEREGYRHALCAKSARELMEASAECTATRLQADLPWAIASKKKEPG